MSFAQAVAFTLAQEGFESDDSKDPGGRTRYGISQRQYPDLDLDTLTRDGAIAIYDRDYWQAGQCDKLPWPLALAHFDACANMGLHAAAQLLQRALGLPPDGIIGPETLGRVQMVADESDVVQALACRQLLERTFAYRRIGNVTFLRGWLLRVEDLYRVVVGP